MTEVDEFKNYDAFVPACFRLAVGKNSSCGFPASLEALMRGLEQP